MIRFASLNIEHSKHLGRVVPFLRDFAADVVCLQELAEPDIPLFEKELGMTSVFAPMCIGNMIALNEGTPECRVGIGIFTKLPVVSTDAHYYVGSPDDTPRFFKDPATETVTINKVLLSAALSASGATYVCATTHFTWSNHGVATPEQRADLKKLFAILDTFPELVLAGDFNAPRGREMWNLIAARYTDNIPPQYTTSLDKNLHRAGDLGLMVDGLFTTPGYRATEVRLTSGVSDHMAVTALVKKVA